MLSHQDSCWSGVKAGTGKQRSMKDAPLQDSLQKHALEKAAGSWVGRGPVFLESRRGQEYVRRAGKAWLNIWGVSEVTPVGGGGAGPQAVSEPREGLTLSLLTLVELAAALGPEEQPS